MPIERAFSRLRRSALPLTRQAYAAGNAGYVQVLDAQRPHEEALGEVQANSQWYDDAWSCCLPPAGASTTRTATSGDQR